MRNATYVNTYLLTVQIFGVVMNTILDDTMTTYD